jgi:hypothetical protein
MFGDPGTVRWRAGLIGAALAATGCVFPGRVSRPAHSTAYVVDAALVALGVVSFIGIASERDDDTGLKGAALGITAGIAATGGLGILINESMAAPRSPPAPSPPPRHADPARVSLARSWSPPIVAGTDPEMMRLDGLARAAAEYAEKNTSRSRGGEAGGHAGR